MKRYSAFLVPLQGLIIRDPIDKLILSKQGETKPLVGAAGRYWRKRLKDGSVKIANPPKVIKKEKPSRRKKEN